MNESILQEAARLVNVDRDDQHGRWADNARVAADLASALGLDASDSRDWPLLMVCLKLARMRQSPANRDNYTDAAGYLQLAYDWSSLP